jgi:hypothetical protein
MPGERRSVLGRAARSATAPVRGYLNDHFEMVKQEVRTSRPGAVAAGDPAAWERVAELESVLAEQSLHQARVLARLSDEVAALSARVAELDRVVRQVAEIVAPPVAEP